uniref:Uncharacterized protein n=1 Tax=Parascaris equorum TaxID=6256 RepID=A0A914RJA5_PAREQ
MIFVILVECFHCLIPPIIELKNNNNVSKLRIME